MGPEGVGMGVTVDCHGRVSDVACDAANVSRYVADTSKRLMDRKLSVTSCRGMSAAWYQSHSACQGLPCSWSCTAQVQSTFAGACSQSHCMIAACICLQRLECICLVSQSVRARPKCATDSQQLRLPYCWTCLCVSFSGFFGLQALLDFSKGTCYNFCRTFAA